MRLVMWCVTAAAMTLTACGSADPGDPAPAADSEPWTVDLQAATQPVGAGGLAIMVVADASAGLHVVALEPATGAERWRSEVTAAATPMYVPLVPVVTTHDGAAAVVVLAPDPAGGARTTVLDAATGEVLVASTARSTLWPAPCADDLAPCPEGSTAAGDTPRLSRPISVDGLLDVRVGRNQLLERWVEGEQVWSRPVESLFGPLSSTDGGWYVFRYGDRYVGHLGSRNAYPPTVTDLRDHATAAFDVDTGEPIWREPATELGCGGALIGWTGVVGDAATPPPVRCRIRSGSIARPGADPDGWSYDDVSVTIEGFDLATGHTTWTVEPDPTDQFHRDDLVFPVLAGASRVVVQDGDGHAVLDLEDGTLQPVESEDDGFVCHGLITFQDPSAMTPAGRTTTIDRIGTEWAEPCTAAGDRSGVPTVNALASLDQTFGDVVVLAGEHSVSGYPLP